MQGQDGEEGVCAERHGLRRVDDGHRVHVEDGVPGLGMRASATSSPPRASRCRRWCSGTVGTSKASTPVPVVAAQEGTALVSGYSKNLVRLFLEADGELTPAAVVADAISGPEYEALVARGVRLLLFRAHVFVIDCSFC